MEGGNKNKSNLSYEFIDKRYYLFIFFYLYDYFLRIHME